MPAEPNDLDALVVAVDGLAASCRSSSGSRWRASSVTTAVSTSPASANAGSTRTRAAREDLDDLAARHEAGHVEVVDRHVEEDPARPAHVLQRRRRRVAAGDAHEVRLADRPVGHRARDRRVGGVEAAVEADLERRRRPPPTAASARSTSARSSDTGFSQKIALPAARRGDDQVGVGVGRRADRDGVDVVERSSSSTLAATRDAELGPGGVGRRRR